jgi:hypothetical protein
MSTCNPGFRKVAIPVDNLPPDASSKDRTIAAYYEYTVNNKKMMNMCVKMCDNGANPMSEYEIMPNSKFVPTSKNIIKGANFTCIDSPYSETTQEKTEEIVTYKCKSGLISYLNPVPNSKPNPMESICYYNATQYPIK